MAWGRTRQAGSWLRLSTVEVNPPKLALYGSYAWNQRHRIRAQTTQVFSQKGSKRAEVERFRGYSTEDVLFLSQLTESSTLRFGVSNVFNHDYKTVYHQWAEATYGASSGAPASGRRISVGYDFVF
jgi:iron complex outermembrane receptor protein